MLSIVVDVLCANSITDVLIVPVGISYERIIEGNYNSEQLVCGDIQQEVDITYTHIVTRSFLNQKQTLWLVEFKFCEYVYLYTEKIFMFHKR